MRKIVHGDKFTMFCFIKKKSVVKKQVKREVKQVWISNSVESFFFFFPKAKKSLGLKPSAGNISLPVYRAETSIKS